ncbi:MULTISPECIES: CopG family transcriptional regulator [unclassified Duganella]|uniref:CopG family transcriptional regulator n=1 Tax=unclassified Duganella TaxID=2636909 RepID=UPI0011C0D286|nr:MULTISPECIES: CopG family transcriptional regulator [unclassified Duganella]
MSVTVSEIEESIKLLSLADKRVLLRALLREIDGHQIPGAQSSVRTVLTLEALDDVDANRFVDHDDVKAWAKSLATTSQLPLPNNKAAIWHTKEYR